jgi:hypothetical protein
VRTFRLSLHSYEIKLRYRANFVGFCYIDPEHKIKRGDVVSRLTLTANPLIPVPGTACAICTRELS